jgi:lysophospholipase-1
MSSSIRRAAPLIVPAVERHTATVIFFHGLGDQGQGWVDVVEMMRQTKRRLGQVKFILPNAPTIPITMNGGFPMPGWFDIKALGPNVDALGSRTVNEDGPGILQSQAYVHSLIQEEIGAGIPSERIMLGGFSQGGAISIFAGLTAPVKIGGIIGLSSWLLLSQSFRDHVPAGDFNKATPILMGHGGADPLVRYPLGKESESVLKGMGYNVTFNTYNGMQHSACNDEIAHVEEFIAATLPPQSS